MAKSGNEFGAKMAKSFSRMSPLAMKIIFEQIRRGKELNYADCMRMEYDMVQTAMEPE